MKHTKRVLSIALVLALALALILPATASEAPNPNAPIITRQPNHVFPTSSILVRTGRSFELEVQARLPDGVTGELSFEWFEVGNDEPVATGPRAVFQIGMNGSIVTNDISFYAVVTNTYLDGDGNEQTASTISEVRDVTIFDSLCNILLGVWFRNFWNAMLLFPIRLFETVFITLSYPIIFLLMSFIQHRAL